MQITSISATLSGRILLDVKTRWLSLEKCVSKAILKFDGLKTMFFSRVEGEVIANGKSSFNEDGTNMSTKFGRLKKVYRDVLSEVHLLFYTSSLPLFSSYNKFLQRSDPLTHKVKACTEELIRKLACRFMIPSAYKESFEITEITIDNEENLLPHDDIMIGFRAKAKLNELFEDGDITQAHVTKMLTAAKSFYRESLRYIIQKMDVVSKPFFTNAVWVDYFQRSEAKWSEVFYFVERFHHTLNFTETDVEELHEQFCDFKVFSEKELPSNALDEALIKSEDDKVIKEYRLDVIWYYLQTLKSALGSPRFNLLFKVAVIVLVTPHSNAGIERVFSLVNKNKSEGSDRNRLSIEGSLSSILAVKLARPEIYEHCCYKYNPSKDLLSKAKKATNVYNSKHTGTSKENS